MYMYLSIVCGLYGLMRTQHHRETVIIWLASILLFVHRGNRSRNLIDLAALVLKYPSSSSFEGSIPIPDSCSMVSGSQIQSTVTTSGFLDPGKYAILPLAFNHWLHHLPTSTRRCPTGSAGKGSSEIDEGDSRSVPYVVALHTGREVVYHKNVTTRPGFLAESLFLLMKTKGKKSSVSVHSST